MRQMKASIPDSPPFLLTLRLNSNKHRFIRYKMVKE
jgi:hypothetical protein